MSGRVKCLTDNQHALYSNGKYMWDDEVALQLADPSLMSDELPIAVLISGQTVSSDEIVLISFIGNKITRTFGQASWGLTTANGAIELLDGSQMYLSSTRMANRNGYILYRPIQPDEFVEAAPDEDNDLVLASAITWLKNVTQPKNKP